MQILLRKKEQKTAMAADKKRKQNSQDPSTQKETERISSLSFEESLERLNRIVETMEDANLPLENAMSSYEEGIHLIRHCRKVLDEAEKKIEILEKGNSEEATASKVRKTEIKINEESGEAVLDDKVQGTLLDLE